MPPKVHAWTVQRLEGWRGKKGVRRARRRQGRWLRSWWMKVMKAMKAKKALKAKIDEAFPLESRRPSWYWRCDVLQ